MTPLPTGLSIAEDAAPSSFGLKLSSILSSSPAITTVAPAGVPATESFSVAAAPTVGDTLTFAFKLPDGTSENIQLTAAAAPASQAGEYLVGATNAATAANITTAFNKALGTLVNGQLVAASSVKASSEFFSNNPPLRVNPVPSPTTATGLVPDPVNTVIWYTGENGPLPARATATAQIDQGVTVQYGMRANEQAFTLQLQNIAVFAAVTTRAGQSERERAYLGSVSACGAEYRAGSGPAESSGCSGRCRRLASDDQVRHGSPGPDKKYR